MSARRKELEAERKRLNDQIDYHQRRYDFLHEHMDWRRAHDLKAQLFDVLEELRGLPLL